MTGQRERAQKFFSGSRAPFSQRWFSTRSS